MRTTIARMALIALSAMPALVHAEWLVGTSAGARYNDNVGNGERSYDRVSDGIISAKLSLTQFLVLNPAYSLTAAADIGGERFAHVTGLDDVSVDASLGLRHKWGLGAFAPWARASLGVGRTVVDYSYRNITLYRASLAGGERLNAYFNLWGEYSFEHRDGQPHGEAIGTISTDAFTQNGHTLTINLETALRDRLTVNVSLLLRHGDVISTTDSFEIFSRSNATALDEAFGLDAWAYRLIGTTYGGNLGVHYALGEHQLIGVGVGHLDTRASHDSRYLNSVVEITWDYRF